VVDFVPKMLELLSQRFQDRPVGLTILSENHPPEFFTHPPHRSPTDLWREQAAREGWRRQELVYAGRRLGTLYHPRPSDPKEVIESFADQLASALHTALLDRKADEQDAKRRILLRRLLSAAEEERRRLARELHDEISQLLTVVQLSLERLDPGDKVEEIERARGLLRKTQEEIHRIIFDLRPTLLDDLGLPVAIRWYAEKYLEREGLDVHLDVEEGLDLRDEIEIAAFRIYQEIVTNILRHARAETVSVELYQDDDRLVLTVEDDGTGFDVDLHTEGSGLVGMRERTNLVDGDLEIISSPGSGTTVRLTVQLPAEESAA
jgi:signal transduction histidine kinase